jgi:hypothetical protein
MTLPARYLEGEASACVGAFQSVIEEGAQSWTDADWRAAARALDYLDNGLAGVRAAVASKVNVDV